MRHFDVAFCADFVRGIVGADDRAALERHIAVCRPCAANLQWLIDVAALTAADARYEPPADVLLQAGAMFETAKPKGSDELQDDVPPAQDAAGSDLFS